MTDIADKKILLLGDLSSPHVEKWANQLVQLGAVVAIFSFVKNSTCHYHPSIQAVIADNRPDSIYELRVAASQVRRFVKRFNPDIIHAHYLTSYGLVASFTGHPFFLSVWGKDIYRLQSRAREIRRAAAVALEQAKLVCSTSNCMARVTRNYTRQRIEIVPFGVETDFFTPQKVANADAPPIVCVTKWMDDAKYGQLVLIEAAGILAARGLPIRVALTGDPTPDIEIFKSSAHSWGIGDRLIFTGRLNKEGIRSLLSRSSIAAFPSRRDDDSFSVSTVEASAMEKPIVASAIGGLLETVVDKRTGLHFSPGDAEEMANCIQEILTDPDRARAMGAAGREFVLEHYDIARNASEMSRLYSIFG